MAEIIEGAGRTARKESPAQIISENQKEKDNKRIPHLEAQWNG